MDFGHFGCVKVLLESSFKSVALGKSIMGSFSGHLNYLFHKIFFSLRRNQIHAQNGVSQEQTSRIIPLYRVAWYRKSVCSAFWVKLTLVACYLPLTVVEALTPQRGPVPISLYLATEFTVTLVFI